MERIYLNKDNVKVDMPVTYYAAPKSIGFNTQVISIPRQVGGVWVVNVAMIPQAVPVNKLVLMHDGNPNKCEACGYDPSEYDDSALAVENYKRDGDARYYRLCEPCAETVIMNERIEKGGGE